MIAHPPFRLIGLKEKDITQEIDTLINSANEAIVIGGYSFTKPTDPKSPLYKLIKSSVPHKHCIFPIGFFGQKQNLPYAKELIKNGVSISFEHENHSKWMMTEKGMYFGSANFSKYSLKNRIEVVVFKDFVNNDPFKKEFGSFSYKSMLRMRRDSNLQNIKGLISKNFKLIQDSKRYVKRLNPSIKKVFYTINNVNDVHYNINQLLQNSYWILDEIHFKSLETEAIHFSKTVNKIYENGSHLIELYEKNWKIEKITDTYNEYCDYFTNKIGHLSRLAEDFLKSSHRLPDHTLENRDLVLRNQRIIKNFK